MAFCNAQENILPNIPLSPPMPTGSRSLKPPPSHTLPPPPLQTDFNLIALQFFITIQPLRPYQSSHLGISFISLVMGTWKLSDVYEVIDALSNKF